MQHKHEVCRSPMPNQGMKIRQICMFNNNIIKFTMSKINIVFISKSFEPFTLKVTMGCFPGGSPSENLRRQISAYRRKEKNS